MGLATAAPFFAGSRADLIALNFLVLAAFYGWAVYRFRSRFWLLTALLTVHLSLGYYLEHLDLWWYADEAWLRFLPLTAALTATGLFVEKRLNEGSPLRTNMLIGWSRPFYLFVFFDVFFSQLGGLRGSYESAGLSLGNTLIVAVLASMWRSPGLAYVSALLGFSALTQWRGAVDCVRHQPAGPFGRAGAGIRRSGVWLQPVETANRFRRRRSGS